EVAETPGADLPGAAQAFEAGDGVRDRMRARPVQEVAVEVVGPEPSQAAFTGRDGAGGRRVVRTHLGYQVDVVAAPGDRPADQFLHPAVAVQLRGRDVDEAEIEPAPEGGERAAPIGLLQHPRSLPDDRHGSARAAEGLAVHGSSYRRPGPAASLARLHGVMACASAPTAWLAW